MARSNGFIGNFNKGIIYKSVGRVEENQKRLLKGCEDGKSRKSAWPLFWNRQGKVVVTRLGSTGLCLQEGTAQQEFRPLMEGPKACLVNCRGSRQEKKYSDPFVWRSDL